MPYSIWSRGRLIGQTDLGFIYRENGFHCGWFNPNELGERVAETATAVSPAMRAAYEAGRDVLTDPDFLSACDQEEALDLQLRTPNGSVIKTEFIHFTDTEYLLSIPDPPECCDAADSFNPEKESIFDSDEDEELRWDDFDDEPWRQAEEWPRYQIQVLLVDHDSVLY